MDFSNLKSFMNNLTAWVIPGNAVSVCIENKEVFRYVSGYENIKNSRIFLPRTR